MFPTVAAVIAALSLAQAAPATPPPAATPSGPPTAVEAAVAPPSTPGPPQTATWLPLVAPGAPALRWGEPARCLVTPAGRFRAQCDAAARRCLVAPDATLGHDGQVTGPLERVGPCALPALLPAEVAGFEQVPALAESPPGFRRDERQRASQISFDLARRVWLGGGWASGGLPWSNQGVVSSGARFDLPSLDAGVPTIVRVRFLEGWAAVDGSAAGLSAIEVDATRAYPHPLLRLTTFVGRPRRFDPPLYAGLWAEALRFETLKTRSGLRYQRTRTAAAALTFDVWRTDDLADFIRLKLGGGYEKVTGGGGDWPLIFAVEGDARLDRDGLHHLRGSLGTELVLPRGAGPAAPLPQRRQRHHVRAEYEWILFSVNDQPASLVVAAGGQRRNDVPDWPTGWVGEVTAQLRFSLWAPPLRAAAKQESLER
jgi:hypothetical protein